MKTLVYHDGPPSIECGAAGMFHRGQPRPVEDDLAKRLLAKTSIRFEEHRPKKEA